MVNLDNGVSKVYLGLASKCARAAGLAKTATNDSLAVAPFFSLFSLATRRDRRSIARDLLLLPSSLQPHRFHVSSQQLVVHCWLLISVALSCFDNNVCLYSEHEGGQ